MKNKLVAAVLIIALFIPTVIAIVSYSTSDKKTTVPAELAEKITVSDLDAREFVYKNDTEEGKTVIAQFKQMLDNAEAISALPDAIDGNAFYKVSLSVDKLETVYQFYFAADGTATYFVTPEGEARRVSSELTAEFLATELAQSVYDGSHAPTLTLSGDFTVLPVDSADAASSWMYVNSTGNFVASIFDKAESAESYDVEGGIALSFDREPDNLFVRVSDTAGNELFNDNYSAIGGLSLDPGTTVNVEVGAKWYEDESRDYYGSMNYRFSATVSAPAEFYPGVTKLERGSLVSISAINVKDPEKIKLSCESDEGIKAVWFKDGDYYRTLIALDFEKGDGTYNIDIEYAGKTRTVSLEVNTSNAGDRDFSPIPFSVDDEVFAACYTDEAKAEFEKLFNELIGSTADVRQWDGAFLPKAIPDGGYGTLYGKMLNVSNNDTSVRHDGVDYTGEGSVVAINGGTVAYAGETAFTGKLVVIDHGWGLKTWYSHLSELNVNSGDTVKKEDVIGKAGSTGFTNTTGVHVSMTLWDRIVMPYNTWNNNTDEGFVVNGVSVGIPMYEKE
jgi:murein DD-endopeptidase MepM/ murein hydrolase activator NlpD